MKRHFDGTFQSPNVDHPVNSSNPQITDLLCGGPMIADNKVIKISLKSALIIFYGCDLCLA